MGKRPSISPLLIDEALAKQDDGFIDLLRSYHDSKRLASITDRWARDHRPWARQQVFKYLDRPWDAVKHETVIKRFFKFAEQQRDDELMAFFLYKLDRYVRRVRRRKHRWDSQTREVVEEEMLRTPATYKSPQGNLFSYRTRYYMRRRAWRYFRRVGFQDAKRYVPAISRALPHYRNDDVARGENILDSWGLVHACFGRSDVLEFSPSLTRVTEGKRLGDLKAEPHFPKLWQAREAGDTLLSLVATAQCRLVRVWAIELLRRWHDESLGDVTAERILALLDHSEAEVQQFGAELLIGNKSLGTLPIETWVKLLGTQNLQALELIVAAMEKHVTPDRLTLERLVQVTCARPVPVARLGLRFLQTRTIATPADRATLAMLSSATCEGAGGEIGRFALSILGAKDHYDPDQVIRFFDSLLVSMRSAAWDWLSAETPGWNDSRLWSRLVESPYEDVRLRFVGALKTRVPAPGVGAEAHAQLWSTVLLGIHRGGRTKLIALGQISDALRDHPDQAEQLLPVLAAAIRSVRIPEAQRGLSAIVSAVEARPELEATVARYLPELKLTAGAA